MVTSIEGAGEAEPTPLMNYQVHNTTHGAQITYSRVKSTAFGRWDKILSAFGLPDSIFSGKHQPCPMCGGKDRFRWDNKNDGGSFICTHCGAGDGFQLIQLYTRCSSADTLHMVASLLDSGESPPIVPAQLHQEKAQKKAKIDISAQKTNERLLNKSKAISPGDIVDQYLRSRGLNLDQYPDDLRFNSNTDYFDNGGYLGSFPAMLAPVRDINGHVVAVHRTYLNADSTKVAPPMEAKKLTRVIYQGAAKGAAIRLYAANEKLAVCEGIETALAVYLLAGRTMPVWACCTSVGLANLLLPPVVRALIICADHDRSGVGQKAALQLAERQTAANVECKIITPDTAGTDWADVLHSEVSANGNI